MLLTATKTGAAPAKEATVFPPSHWKHVFKLLGLIILADKKVFKEEIDAYLEVVAELRAVIDPTVSLTAHMARDWFMLNKSEILETIESLAYDTALCETLAPIRSMPHKLDVITGMVKIAVAGSDYSGVKKSLIKKTILYWNVPSTSQDRHAYTDAMKHIENV